MSPEMSVHAASCQQRPKILLVEDEMPVREMLSRVLYRQGYELLVAADGAEAVALRDEDVTTIDLLISDLIMPGPNGADVARTLRQRAPHLNVLFMSGCGDHPVLHRVLSGGEKFIGKPFSLAQFKQVVDRALIGQAES
jgi:two-component system cell cycle sensor histidine kinase/response regulator CckA